MWPNTRWFAEQAVQIEEDGAPWRLEAVRCGRLKLPSGKLIVCDPFACLRATGNPYVDVPKGIWDVTVTIADVSGKDDRSHCREAYASITFSSKPGVIRRPMRPSDQGTASAGEQTGSFYGYGVDAGTACFADKESVERLLKPIKNWNRDLFDHAKPDAWFKMMDNPKHIRAGIADIALPKAAAGENLILFHSGWGDGSYPIIGEYGSEGALVKVHTDFFVVAPEGLPEENGDED